jgi:hypothetical protein
VWYICTKISYSSYFQIYSRLIEFATGQQNNAQVSSLLADRAGIYLVSKQYQSNLFTSYPIRLYTYLSSDALDDSNRAINLEQTNIYGHIRKW